MDRRIDVVLSHPVPTKMGGKFYDVKQRKHDGSLSPISFTTHNCPLRTFGINRWGSLFLYSPVEKEDGVDKFLEIYEETEDVIHDLLKDSGITSGLASRVKVRDVLRGSKRISTKLLFEDKEKTLLKTKILDLNENEMSTSEFSKGKCYDIYPVITLRSVFVNKSKGIIPQLYVSKAYVFPAEEKPEPVLDLTTIRERYASVFISRAFKQISFVPQEERKEE